MQFLVSDLVLAETEAHPDWPPGYFRQTFGAFRDDPLERPEQGKLKFGKRLHDLPNDLLIAAIALANQLTMVTHNVKEFSRVSDLPLEDREKTTP